MNPIKQISVHRTSLMALATLAILFTHLPAVFETFAIARLKMLGIMGVDVFFFVSGFGLYYSYLKNPSPKHFYLKRLRRIFPPFIALLLLHLWWSDTWSWTTFLRHASTLGFWVPAWKWSFFGWYVSAILLCYLLFPILFFGLRRRPALTVALVTLIGLALCGVYAYYFLVLHPGGYNCLILFFGRIPIFAFGALCGQIAQRPDIPHPRLTEWSLIILAIVAFIGLNLLLDTYGYKTMRNSGVLFLLPALVVPGLCLATARILPFLGKALQIVLAYIGAATLEAYLMLGDVYSLKAKTAALLHISDERITALLLMALCVILAYFSHRIIDYAESMPSKLLHHFAAKKNKKD